MDVCVARTAKRRESPSHFEDSNNTNMHQNSLNLEPSRDFAGF